MKAREKKRPACSWKAVKEVCVVPVGISNIVDAYMRIYGTDNRNAAEGYMKHNIEVFLECDAVIEIESGKYILFTHFINF